jgi:hypothetical protein
MHQFLKFILEENSTCFGQFLCPSSGVFHRTYSNGICHTGFQTAHEQDQVPTCMTYTIAVCTVKNSWWWTEKLSETCRVSFQNKWEIAASIWFYYKKFVTMHGHMNVKFIL